MIIFAPEGFTFWWRETKRNEENKIYDEQDCGEKEGRRGRQAALQAGRSLHGGAWMKGVQGAMWA